MNRDFTPIYLATRQTLQQHRPDLRSGCVWLWLDEDSNGICVFSGDFKSPALLAAFAAEPDADVLPDILDGAAPLPTRAIARLAGVGVTSTDNSFKVRQAIRRALLIDF